MSTDHSTPQRLHTSSASTTTTPSSIEAVRRSSSSSTRRTSPSPARTTPQATQSGLRTFDPFAPLSPPPSRTTFTPTSPSLQREARPPSLYIPIEGSEADPQWPFDSNNHNPQTSNHSGSHLFASQPTPQPIHSPSQINPAYAVPFSPQSNTSATPGSSVSPNQRKSPRVGYPQDDEAGMNGEIVTQLEPRRPELGNKYDEDPRKSPSASKRALHSTSYSLGTHALLSSRQSIGSRIAARMDGPAAWLCWYFAFNLGLTLYNKLVLQGFPFPWTLTGIQMLAGTIGTQVALNRGYFVQANLSIREGAIMIAFSTLYTINIAVSNLSLHLVTVPFHQVVRAMTPLFTIMINTALSHKRYSRDTYLSLLPVVLGVCFATYGDYFFTAWGLILTLLGTLLAALKTITTNRVQVGKLKLHPLDLLIRMSPLAFMQCVFWGWYSGELERVRVYGATKMTRSKAVALLMNGVIAFGLNVVSFTANKKTSALTMTVAANVKQVLTIILAVLIFNLTLNLTNLFGITLTLAGGFWYARIELLEKSKQQQQAQSSQQAGSASGSGSGSQQRLLSTPLMNSPIGGSVGGTQIQVGNGLVDEKRGMMG